MDDVQQHARAADASRQPADGHARRAASAGWRSARLRRRPGRFAPDALIVDAGHPLRSRARPPDCSSCRTRRRSSCRCSPARTPGPLVLDTCASPGGKTTALAAASAPRGRVVACDVRDRRIDAAPSNGRAGSAPAMSRIVQADLLAPLPFRALFDCVLVDAPCSGLGTLRRDPDIRWRRQEADLAPLAAAQLRMLRHAADAVRPAGGSSMRPARASRRRTSRSSSAFLRLSPGFADGRCPTRCIHSCRQRSSTTADTCARVRIVTPRGLLRGSLHRSEGR